MVRPAKRYRTLKKMEEILKMLVDRHGARMTLGELLTITSSMARLCEQDAVTVAEIADATGLPKQSVSRWARKRIDTRLLVARTRAEDERVTEYALVNRDQAADHLKALGKTLGLH